TRREPIHDYLDEYTGKVVEAHKQLFLDEVPSILVLHLKRVAYDKSGFLQKVMKRISFGENLEIPHDCFLNHDSGSRMEKGVGGRRQAGVKKYKLLAGEFGL